MRWRASNTEAFLACAGTTESERRLDEFFTRREIDVSCSTVRPKLFGRVLR